MPLERKLLTPVQVSEILQIPKSSLYKLCNEGDIPAVRVGRHWRFDPARIEKWLEDQFDAPRELKRGSDAQEPDPDQHPKAQSGR